MAKQWNRVLAIGDIHGCSRAFDALLAAVAPGERDLIITLGDYVSRGLDSAGVIDRLVRLHAAGNLVALRGNHEEMMMRAREDRSELNFWKNCGGDAALISYAPDGGDGKLSDIPAEHWRFLDRVCIDYFEIDTHFFVHGGARTDLPLADQTPLVLRWETFNDPPPHMSGKVMVGGHTPQKSGRPRSIGHAVCIDTAAHDKGWLTCLDVRSGQYWQASERGETRRGSL